MTLIQFRRGTAANWTSTNPTLAAGEVGFETDSGKFKIGTGALSWTALGYAAEPDLSGYSQVGHAHPVSQISDSTAIGRSLVTAATTAAARTAIGAGTSNLVLGTTSSTAKAGDWVPSFADITGTLSSAQVPPLAINDIFTVASQTAMTSLTAQRGDMAIRTDNGETYVLSTDSPGTAADWKMITAPGNVTSVAGKQGAVTLVKADVGLSNVDNTADSAKPVSSAQQTALNLKANLASPTFTGTVTLPSTTNGLSKSNVGLGSVDNTSDLAKPVSTATQTALNGKANSSHTHVAADITSVDGGAP